jgi:hypothetical protein
MRVPNDLNFDTETYLMFGIHYIANGNWEGMDRTAATHMKAFEKEINAMCKVFAWLGLAVPAKNSPLGWKPSHRLTSLIVNPRKRSFSKKDEATHEDNELFDAMLDASLNEEVPYVLPFIASALAVLGLVNLTRSGDFIPSPQLREIVARRRQEDRWEQDDQPPAKSAAGRSQAM